MNEWKTKPNMFLNLNPANEMEKKTFLSRVNGAIRLIWSEIGKCEKWVEVEEIKKENKCKQMNV